MGGSFAFQQAIREPRLAACVVNYGVVPTSRPDIQKLNAPVLGHFGALDRGILPRRVRAFAKALNQFHKSVNIKIYDGTDTLLKTPITRGAIDKALPLTPGTVPLSFTPEPATQGSEAASSPLKRKKRREADFSLEGLRGAVRIFAVALLLFMWISFLR